MNKYDFKGTAGPWKHYFLTPEAAGVQDVAESGELPAFQSKSIYVGGDKIVCTVNSMNIGNFSELEHFEANAHLIAAAPDLLEACIKMVEACNKHNLTEVVPEHETMITAIHKALNIEI